MSNSTYYEESASTSHENPRAMISREGFGPYASFAVNDNKLPRRIFIKRLLVGAVIVSAAVGALFFLS